MIAFPEGTTALLSDDEARSLKKWNQLWYDAYGNAGTVPYPEGTEPLPGDDAHRSLVKLQALKRAASDNTFGPELLSGTYDSEGGKNVTLVSGHTYRWVRGSGETGLYETCSGIEFYSDSIYFVACGTAATVYGTPLGPITGSVRECLTCTGDHCYEGSIVLDAVYGEGGGGTTYPLTLVLGATYLWIKGANDLELHNGPSAVLTTTGTFVSADGTGTLVGQAGLVVTGGLYKQVPCV